MAISDKLTYLNTTKSNIKDAINLTNANILSEDTFRSYAEKLKLGLIDIINNGTDDLYDSFPKTTGTGTEIALNDTYTAPMRTTLKGNTEKCGHIRGKIAINNGKIYKYVFEQDFINTYQFQGWIRGNGNLHKNTCKNKNKIRINNESGAKYVTIEEWENKYSKEGWHRGYDWKK